MGHDLPRERRYTFGGTAIGHPGNTPPMTQRDIAFHTAKQHTSKQMPHANGKIPTITSYTRLSSGPTKPATYLASKSHEMAKYTDRQNHALAAITVPPARG